MGHRFDRNRCGSSRVFHIEQHLIAVDFVVDRRVTKKHDMTVCPLGSILFGVWPEREIWGSQTSRPNQEWSERDRRKRQKRETGVLSLFPSSRTHDEQRYRFFMVMFSWSYYSCALSVRRVSHVSEPRHSGNLSDLHIQNVSTNPEK